MAVTINGSAGVTTNSGAVYDSLQRATAVASTSGTSIDFTGIPSWVKRITVMFYGVSTSGTSNWQVQIGAGSITTSGYASLGCRQGASSTVETTAVTGFLIVSANASNSMSGVMTLNLITGNTWVSSHGMASTNGGVANYNGGGSLALSGTLDRVRITTVNGTDTFDAGTINIIYE